MYFLECYCDFQKNFQKLKKIRKYKKKLEKHGKNLEKHGKTFEKITIITIFFNSEKRRI